MLGAIAGDIAGSAYEGAPWRGNNEDLPLFTAASKFTDDTVMTFAVAEAMAKGYGNPEFTREELIDCMHDYGRKYPDAGYGGSFSRWLGLRERGPYNSYGNGSAMRVSPVAWAYDTLEDVEKYAELSAAVTHNHPEGIKGACAVAGAIFLARQNASKQAIKDYVESKYGYNLHRPLSDLFLNYKWSVTCQESVPEAIIAFLESENFEDAIRNAICLRGDADTQAAIAGAIAEAFYGGMPDEFIHESLGRLDTNLYLKYNAWITWLGDKGGISPI